MIHISRIWYAMLLFIAAEAEVYFAARDVERGDIGFAYLGVAFAVIFAAMSFWHLSIWIFGHCARLVRRARKRMDGTVEPW